jgi:hypothetical protein
MTASSSIKKSSGCGCGGGGSPAAAPCKCGGAECSLCQDQGYVRPRFFAGQLLTEDDLQQLDDYVVSKNRLHMRHLFGAGVVCGLEVTCYPCGGGKVMVNPGYALDCCGNDIVVSCSKELDINQMVRELLRKQKSGFDCGDPCADVQKPAPKPGSQTNAAGASLSGSAEGTVPPPPPAKHMHKYCLYIDYCEQASDPVSPYATDDPCAPTSCETTRIREGFRFELRCPPDAPDNPGICGSIKDCLGDSTAWDRVTYATGQMKRYGDPISAAVKAYTKEPAFDLLKSRPNFISEFQNHVKALESLLEETKQSDPAKIRANLLPKLATATRDLGMDFAGLALDPTAVKNGLGKELQGGGALDQLKSAAAAINSVVPSPAPEDLDSAFATSIVALANEAIDLYTRTASASGQEFSARAAVLPQDVKVTLQLLARGGAIEKPLYVSIQKNLANIRGQLANRYEQTPSKTRCNAVETINATPVPRTVITDELNLNDVSGIVRAGQAHLVLVRDFENDCLCNAINPPCLDCADTGVLLACLTVEDCQVIDICNLERTFVLTGPTLRYWFPEIQRLGDAIEKVCCPSRCPDESVAGGRSTYETGTTAAEGDASSRYAEIILRLRAALCRLESHKDITKLDFMSLAKDRGLSGLQAILEGLGPQGLASHEAQPMAAPAAVAAEAEPAESLAEKLRIAQQLSQLSRDHQRLSERLAKLERAAKKGGNPDS